MIAPEVERLRSIQTFSALVGYLREELDWPIAEDMAEEDMVYDYTPEEVGLDPANAVKIERIVRLRPLVSGQPWGIFYIDFRPGRLPVTVLRRILRALVVKKRATSGDRQAWELDDLLFISTLGESGSRGINLAHFSQDGNGTGGATLRVVDWDEEDTHFHLLRTADELYHLRWPEDPADAESWRETWSSAFALKPGEVAKTSRQLAVEMARLARLIRNRVNAAMAVESDEGPLRRLYNAFQEVLLHDLTEDDFADMYAQTITYGLFAARKSRPMGITAENARDMVPKTNPFLRDLLAEFTEVSGLTKSLDFDELGIDALVEMLNLANMEAVIADFGDRNPLEDPVIHFYEFFLKEYDPKKRVKRGIFFTPRPVVSFIVRSVDELLRTEFDLEDGLADTATWGDMIERHPDLRLPTDATPDMPFVQVLDPATGTGTFLVEVIDVIHRTMTQKWQREGHLPMLDIPQLWNEYVAHNLLPRLYGFELMMAPYAIAHMKVGLKLSETGYNFSADERLRIYLTNTLEEPRDFSGQFETMAPALAHEAQAVNAIKRHQRFTVVIGNPPYAVKSYNNSRWIRGLLEDFKKGLSETKLNLDDDYIKFLRYAAHQSEMCGVGAFSMITNNIFLSGVTHRQLRSHLLGTFTAVTITNLHGDTRYGEVAPPGCQNKNVFDIQQGVCVSCFVRHPRSGVRTVNYADVWGSRHEKSAQLATPDAVKHVSIYPAPPLYYFQPAISEGTGEYQAWPLLTEWMPVFSNGIETHKDGLTIHFTKAELRQTIQRLLSLPVEKARSALGVGGDGRDWQLSDAIKSLRAMVARGDKETAITYRPFDVRYTLLNQESGGFIAYPRWDVMANLVRIPGNVGLISARLMARGGVWDSCLATRYPTEKKTGDSTRSSTVFPLLVLPNDSLQLDGHVRANLSRRLLEEAGRMLDGAGKSRPLSTGAAEHMFWYIYASLYSSSYRGRYAEHLKSDFPRLPLTGDVELFRALARLGGELVALHLMESPKLDHHITSLVGSADIQVEKVAYSDGTVWLDKAKTRGFRGVPQEVWNFHIGGYRVCEKWLKYRRGRVLSPEDITHYQRIVVALNETIRLMGEIDDVIEAHGGWPDAFRSVAADPTP